MLQVAGDDVPKAPPSPPEGYAGAVNGSRHPWLEDREPKMSLLIVVDDATGSVTQAVFHTTEDIRSYLMLLESLVRQWGLPLAIYSDRYSAFKYNARQKTVPVETILFVGVIWESSRYLPPILRPNAEWNGCL